MQSRTARWVGLVIAAAVATFAALAPPWAAVLAVAAPAAIAAVVVSDLAASPTGQWAWNLIFEACFGVCLLALGAGNGMTSVFLVGALAVILHNAAHRAPNRPLALVIAASGGSALALTGVLTLLGVLAGVHLVIAALLAAAVLAGSLRWPSRRP